LASAGAAADMKLTLTADIFSGLLYFLFFMFVTWVGVGSMFSLEVNPILFKNTKYEFGKEA